MIYLGVSLSYLHRIQYSDPKEVLDKLYDPMEFPCSFFLLSRYDSTKITSRKGLLCMPDNEKDENVDDGTKEEKEHRLKHNYVYTKHGVRKYPMDDGFFKHYRSDYKSNCSWKYYRGKCIVHDLKDDLYHRSHVEVRFEFQPKMTKQLASDLNELFQVDYFNPTYDFVVNNGIKVGNVYECQKRKRIAGDRCPSYDYDFVQLDKIREKEDEAEK